MSTFCNQLFAIECQFHDATPEERHKARLEHSRPILDAFSAWLKYQSPRVLPKSAFGQAINYCRNQWAKLENFLLDGRLEMDNNRRLSKGIYNPQDLQKALNISGVSA